MNCLVFDIETIPDVAFGRRPHDLDGLPDESVAKAMFALRRQGTGNDFLPFEQQRVVAISCVLRSRDGLKVWSLGDVSSGEAELLERFFDGIERFSPDLISWNGSGFDLPVLTLRALAAGVQAPRYWETGDGDTAFRYNNYLSRYHWRHTDLMDVLSGFQGRGRVSLQNAAYLLGLKLAMVRAGQRGLDQARVLDLGIYIIISALVGAKLLLVVTDFRTFASDPSELVTLARSGGVFYGGLILAVVVALWYIRRIGLPLWTTCDVFAPAGLLPSLFHTMIAYKTSAPFPL